MNPFAILRALLPLILTLSLARPGLAQPTAFTYQGRLLDADTPATGSYDIRATLHNALVDGGQISDAVTNLAVTVAQGHFTVPLDFGAKFDGQPLWLEIAVRKAGEETFVPLLPRQALTPTPYALHALSVTPSAITGAFAGVVVFTNTANQFGGDFTGRFAGDGNSIENVNAATLGGLGTNHFWKTDGNAGTDPGTNFLGTTDDTRLDFRVNGITAASFIPTRNSLSIILGQNSLVDESFAVGCSILGGSGHTVLPGEFETAHCTIGGGSGNTVSGFANNIGGGIANDLRSLSSGSTIGGGERNSMFAYTEHSVIAGGLANAIGGRDSSACTISGGSGNAINGGFGGEADTIGGGAGNSIQPSIQGGYATISGGSYNSIGGKAYATISGGNGNSIMSGGEAGTIGGGHRNAVRNEYATIAGGRDNEANGPFATVPGGVNASARLHAQIAHAGGSFATNGDAQASAYICRATTTDNTQTEIFLDGSNRRIELPDNSTWTFDILVTARATNALSAGYQIRGVILNSDGVTSFLGTPVITTLAETSYTWDATVIADEANKSLAIKVTGDLDTSIRWVASVRTVEVSY